MCEARPVLCFWIATSKKSEKSSFHVYRKANDYVVFSCVARSVTISRETLGHILDAAFVEIRGQYLTTEKANVISYREYFKWCMQCCDVREKHVMRDLATKRDTSCLKFSDWLRRSKLR